MMRITNLFLTSALISALLSFTNLVKLDGQVTQMLFFLFLTLWAVSVFIIRNGDRRE